jgi:hypothetical protein
MVLCRSRSDRITAGGGLCVKMIDVMEPKLIGRPIVLDPGIGSPVREFCYDGLMNCERSL